MVQREGRILRQGNTNDDVMIYRYITEGSFDSYSWQILETKQRFISQFLSGSSYQRTASELESNVLTYSEVKAIALSQPFMKILAEKENEMKNLQILISKNEETRESAKKELEEIEIELPVLKQNYITAISHSNYLNKKQTTDFASEYHKIENLLSKEVVTGEIDIAEKASVLGFDISLPETIDTEKPYVLLEKNSNKYKVEMSESSITNAKRIIRTLKTFKKIVEKYKELFDKALSRKAELKKLIDADDYAYRQKLSECEEEVKEIKSHIKGFDEQFITE